MNWKGYGRKQSWLNSRNYPGICLSGLRGTKVKTKTSVRIAKSLGQDLKLGSPKYKVGVLTTWPWHSAQFKRKTCFKFQNSTNFKGVLYIINSILL
jgi:hypothetical protein